MKITILICSLGLWFANAYAQADFPYVYESYLRYLGNYPSNITNYYSDEINGVCNDARNWYFAPGLSIVKVPFTTDLKKHCPFPCSPERMNKYLPGVKFKPIREESDLKEAFHMGDPDQEGGFLFVPVTIKEKGCHVAIFRADDMTYIGCAPTADDSWCAVGPDGKGNRVLYTGLNPAIGTLARYRIDWEALKSGRGVNIEPLPDDATNPYQLKNEDGTPYVFPTSIQGGDFSLDPEGSRLYLVIGENKGCEDCCAPPDWGILVFDTSSGRKVYQSTCGRGLFNFEFYPNDKWGEEPEGLTICDLDEKGVPGIKGQLHVVLRNNSDPWSDGMWFKHYANTIFVLAVSSHSEGTFEKPFKTVNEALGFAWYGSRIVVRKGTYRETVVVRKIVKIRGSGGRAVIGKSGSLVLARSGVIKIGAGYLEVH